MGLCGSRSFLLRELFILCGDDFEEGISGFGADDGDALGWQGVFSEVLKGCFSVGPAGAKYVQQISGVWPCGTASSNKTGRDGEGDGCNA